MVGGRAGGGKAMSIQFRGSISHSTYFSQAQSKSTFKCPRNGLSNPQGYEAGHHKQPQ